MCSSDLPGLLGPVARALQGREGDGHLVTLQFDHAVFEGAAGAGCGLELFEQGLELRFTAFQARDRRHQLSAFAGLGALHPDPLEGLGGGFARWPTRPLQAGLAADRAEFLPAALGHGLLWEIVRSYPGINHAAALPVTSTIPSRPTDPAELVPQVRPTASGRFGPYGGQYVPETLMPALAELEVAAAEAWADPAFTSRLDHLLRTYVGRATPLYEAEQIGRAHV